MKRLTIPVLATLLLAGSALPAAALTFLDVLTGDEGALPDARSIAMGRTGLADVTGPFTGRANPAMLSRLKGPVAAVGGGVVKIEESRSTPLYDSFDGFLVNAIYVFNDNFQWEQGAGLATSLDVGGRRLGLGASVSAARDFQYDYTEEVRDNNAFTQPRDRLLGENRVESDGSLDAWSLAASYEVADYAQLGVGLELLRGEQEMVMKTRFVQEGTEETSTLDFDDLSGQRVVVGAAVHPHHSVSFAATWTSEATLDGDVTLDDAAGHFARLVPGDVALADSVNSEMVQPQTLRVGATYRPRARLETTVRLDLGWTEWSAYQHALLDESAAEDVWDVRFGIEHVFYNNFPARFGFHYRPSPIDDEVATTAFTFGSGFDYGPLRAALAFEIANRQYRYDDLFDDAAFGGSTRTQADRVEESSSAAYFTLSYDIPPFGG